MSARWCLLFVWLRIAGAADPTANEIMARVAENQDKAVSLRGEFVYQEQVNIATRHFNGKLAREEKAAYDIAPGAKTSEHKITAISGSCEDKGHVILFRGEPRPRPDSLDADLIDSFRDDLLNSQNRDGVAANLFPLTTDEQKKYRFELLGHKQIEGRDSYQIGLARRMQKTWTGRARLGSMQKIFSRCVCSRVCRAESR